MTRISATAGPGRPTRAELDRFVADAIRATTAEWVTWAQDLLGKDASPRDVGVKAAELIRREDRRSAS